MLTNTLKAIGFVGVVGTGIGGGVTYAISASKAGPYWDKKLSETGPILSCQGSDGAKYELFLQVGEGAHLEEEFDPKAYKVKDGKKEPVTALKDFLYFWLHHNYNGKFESVSIQTLTEANSLTGDYGQKIQCQDSKIETDRRRGGEGRVNLGQMRLRADKGTCIPKGENVTSQICNLQFLKDEHLKWAGTYQPKVTYTWISK